MIKNVVFDFADTIAELVPNDVTVFDLCINKKLGVSIDKEIMSSACRFLHLQYFYSSVNIKDSYEKKKFYREYNTLFFKIIGLYHKFQHEIDEIFYYFNNVERRWRLKEGVRELFVHLKNGGFSIGILSNFDKQLRNIICRKFKLGDYVDYMFISQEIGTEKPDINFYKQFLEKYKLEICETLYVGDNYVLDFLPAVSRGIKTLILDENKFLPDYEYVIHRIDEVIEHL